MLLLDLMNAIIAKLKTIAVFNSRVLAIPSRAALPDGWPVPMAGVVYRGSTPHYQKGGAVHWTHRFSIYIVDVIWQQEAVVTGISGGQDGILSHLKSAMDALKAELFTDSATLVGKVANATITSLLGSEDYLDNGWYGASVGFEIEYYQGE